GSDVCSSDLEITRFIQGVPAKSGNLLRHDQVKPPRFSILDHAMKVLTFLCSSCRQAFVYVAVHIGPTAISADQITVILDLIVQGVELLITLTGHPRIEGHPQWEVIDRPGL